MIFSWCWQAHTILPCHPFIIYCSSEKVIVCNCRFLCAGNRTQLANCMESGDTTSSKLLAAAVVPFRSLSDWTRTTYVSKWLNYPKQSPAITVLKILVQTAERMRKVRCEHNEWSQLLTVLFSCFCGWLEGVQNLHLGNTTFLDGWSSMYLFE